MVDIPEVTQPVQPEAQLSDTIAHKDTVVEAVQPQPVVKKEPTAEPVKAESKPHPTTTNSFGIFGFRILQDNRYQNKIHN